MASQTPEQARAPAKSSATVTVACKIPNGVILRLHRFEEMHEPVLGGGTRTVKQAVHVGDPVRILGNSRPQDGPARGDVLGGDNGFALTYGVSREFWDEWLAQNATHQMVRSGLIFAHEEFASVKAEAKEKIDIRSGTERLDPNKLPSRAIKTDKDMSQAITQMPSQRGSTLSL